MTSDGTIAFPMAHTSAEPRCAHWSHSVFALKQLRKTMCTDCSAASMLNFDDPVGTISFKNDSAKWKKQKWKNSVMANTRSMDPYHFREGVEDILSHNCCKHCLVNPRIDTLMHLVHLSFPVLSRLERLMPLLRVHLGILSLKMPNRHAWESLVLLGPLLPMTSTGRFVQPCALSGKRIPKVPWREGCLALPFCRTPDPATQHLKQVCAPKPQRHKDISKYL